MFRHTGFAAQREENAVGGVDAVEIFGDFSAQKTLRDGLRWVAFDFNGAALLIDRDQDRAGVGAVVGADGVNDAEGGCSRGHETILCRMCMVNSECRMGTRMFCRDFERSGMRGAEERVYTGFAMSCLFCKIIDGTIPSVPVYQDDLGYAFADINPKAPVHVLIVPREHISSLDEAGEGKRVLLGHLLWTAAEIARQKGLTDGYRIVVNTGEDGGQTVEHLHLHLLGGRQLSWPPG